MFGMPQLPVGASSLVQMKCGKMNLAGTTISSDARKGMLALRKSEDGLMHLIWKDRTANQVVDDLIVFEGDASIRRLDECKDGYGMLLEFSQTARKLFFYSQEPRKKGADWENTTKEKELMDKVNAILTGGPAAAAPASAATGALGMTHNELMAILGQAVVPAPNAGAAPAAAATASATSEAAPAPATDSAPATAAPGAPPSAFTADAISSILSGIPTTGGAPAAAGQTAFSADAISSILSGIAPAGPPLSIGEVLRPEEAAPKVDAAMEASLSEHLPESDTMPETTAETLSTPQMAQASTDAEQQAAAAASTAEPMETEKTDDKPAADKMEE